MRRSPEYGKDIILRIDKGQFLCFYEGCTVKMKFDNGNIEKYHAVESSDGSANALFLEPYDKIVNKIRQAKHLMIEAQFYQEGYHQLEFDVTGLQWQ